MNMWGYIVMVVFVFVGISILVSVRRMSTNCVLLYFVRRIELLFFFYIRVCSTIAAHRTKKVERIHGIDCVDGVEKVNTAQVP